MLHNTEKVTAVLRFWSIYFTKFANTIYKFCEFRLLFCRKSIKYLSVFGNLVGFGAGNTLLENHMNIHINIKGMDGKKMHQRKGEQTNVQIQTTTQKTSGGG